MSQRWYVVLVFLRSRIAWGFGGEDTGYSDPGIVFSVTPICDIDRYVVDSI